MWCECMGFLSRAGASISPGCSRSSGREAVTRPTDRSRAPLDELARGITRSQPAFEATFKLDIDVRTVAGDRRFHEALRWSPRCQIGMVEFENDRRRLQLPQ